MRGSKVANYNFLVPKELFNDVDFLRTTTFAGLCDDLNEWLRENGSPCWILRPVTAHGCYEFELRDITDLQAVEFKLRFV